MLPSIRIRIFTGTFNSQWTINGGFFHNNTPFFHLYIWHCHCYCVIWFGLDVSLFSLLCFPFFAFLWLLLLFNFQLLGAIRFHLFAIEIFMRCVTFAHCDKMFCFVFMRSICSFFLLSFFFCCCCFWFHREEKERFICVCFREVI